MRGGLAVFLRALDPAPEEKGEHLRRLIAELRSEDGAAEDGQTFEVEPDEFEVVPGSPFAYWVGEPIRRIFREFPPLEGNVGTVKQGLATAKDFRFVRAWWEVDPRRIGYSPEDTEEGRGWVHFAKGGSYSPYYADVHLVVNWFDRGAEIKNFDRAYVRNEDFYFRPGLTFPRRTRRLAPSALPEDCIFSHGGQAAFPLGETRADELLGLLASLPFFALLRVQLPRLDGDPQFEVGQIQRTPAPSGLASLGAVARELVRVRRDEMGRVETLHPFTGLVDNPASKPTHLETTESQRLLDQTAFQLFGMSDEEAIAVKQELGGEGVAAAEEVARGREDHDDAAEARASSEQVAELLQWSLGVAFGRWDVRMARDPTLLPELMDPFGRLPRVAPAGLVDSNGFPANRAEIASEAWLRARPDVLSLPEASQVNGPASITAAEYPIDVAWNGILVDDPDHERDIVRKVREVLEYVFGDGAPAFEEKAMDVLRADGRTPRTLRDWFRNQKATELSKSFFDFHISRYSMSRRKAAIYWRLCTSPGRGQSDYGVWLYYHRLTDDTLWTVLNQYVGPKRRVEEDRLAQLREGARVAEGGERRRMEKEVEETEDMLEELRWFQDQLRDVAGRGYAPDLDDGVILNMAPLHAVIPWNEAERTWRKLESGEYDWSKLAMRYWPERVREACREDRSFAIAQGMPGPSEL